MEQYKKEICRDCDHHKITEGGIICSLTGEKPHYEHNCIDFSENNNWIGKYLAGKRAERDEYESAANVWLAGLGSLSVVTLILGSARSIEMEKYMYIYLFVFATLAALALAVYMFIRYREKCYRIDIETTEQKIKHSISKATANESSSSQVNQETVTTDRIIAFLKDIGYAPKCERADDGIYWIYIVYGDTPIYTSYSDNVLQVIAPYEWGDDMQDSAKIHNFLLAANVTMAEKRFVQITGNVSGCNFAISGIVNNCTEAFNILPIFFRAIEESVKRHRQIYDSYRQQDDAQRQQRFSTNNVN